MTVDMLPDWAEGSFGDGTFAEYEECLRRRDKVDEFISDSAAAHSSYIKVKDGVEQINKSLDFREEQYVKLKYVQCCTSHFIDRLNAELPGYLKDLGSDRQLFVYFSKKCLDDTQTMQDVAKNFSFLDSCVLISNCIDANLISKNIAREFLTKLKHICWEHLCEAATFLQIEKNFITELDSCCMKCFKEELEDERFNELMYYEKDTDTSVEQLFDLLLDTPDSNLARLQSIASELGEVADFRDDFKETIAKVLEDTFNEPSIDYVKKRDRTVAVIRNRFLSLKQVDTLISEAEEHYDEVHIMAQKFILADTSLEWPETNLVIMAPEITVKDKVELVVSGRHGVSSFTEDKAKNGQEDGEDGEAGKHGAHGGSGGNVVIIANEIKNFEQIEVVSDGGDGGNGQSGGDGKDGRDGTDGTNMSEADFKERFPKCAHHAGPFTRDARRKNLENIPERDTYECDDDSSWYQAGVKSVFCTGKTREGNDVEFSFYDGTTALNALVTLTGYPTRQAYCLVKGTKGTKGQEGGDGGRGGHGGQGGFPGHVVFKTMNGDIGHWDVEVRATRGSDGKDGKDGKGGKGGKNGENGIDRGRVDPSSNRFARWYKGNLSVSFTNDDDVTDSAYCPKKEMYAMIKESSVHQSRRENGQKGKNTKGVRRQRENVRQNAILVDEIYETYQNAFQGDHYTESMADVSNSDLHTSSLKSEASQDYRRNEIRMLVDAKNDIDDPRIRLDEKLLSYIPSKHNHSKKREVTPIEPIHASTDNEILKSIIKDCNKNPVEQWIFQFAAIIGEMENNEIQEDFEAETLLACFKALFLNLRRSVQWVNGRNMNILFRLLSQSKATFQTPEIQNTLIDIEAFLLKKDRLLVLTELSDFVREALQQQENFHIMERLMDYELLEIVHDVMAITDIQKLCAYKHDKKEDLQAKIDRFGSYDVDSDRLPLVTIASRDESEDEKSESEDEKSDVEVHPDQTGSYVMSKGKAAWQTISETVKKVTNYALTSKESKETGESSRNIFSSEIEDEVEDKIEEKTEEEIKNEIEDEIKDGDFEMIDELEMEWKESLSALPHDIQKWIGTLQYLPEKDISLLLHLICTRLVNESVVIEPRIIQWLVTRVLVDSEIHGLSDFVVLFGTRPQRTWLAEYIILQLREKIFVTMNELNSLTTTLLDAPDHQILPLLSRQLMSSSPGSSLKVADIEEILRVSKNVEIDEGITKHLSTVNIVDWPYRLRWFQGLLQLKQLKTTQPWDGSEMVECAYHLSQLANKHGASNTDFLMCLLQGTEVNTTVLITVLRRFDSNLYMFDEKSISAIQNEKMSKWTKILDSIFVPDKDRDVDDLKRLMKLDSNNSGFVLESIDEIAEYVKDINEMKNITSTVMSSSKCIGNFDKYRIKKWANTLRTKTEREEIVRENLNEVMAVVNRAVELCKGFSLRDTQKLSVVMFLHSGSGMLQQVATGEGKSLIIASIAIIKALSGENVDIITSSSVLASRDAKIHEEFYELFGVKVGHNTSELAADRKAIYTNKDVVYGTMSAFQRDLLLDEFYNEDVGVASRPKGWIIVDEVDSLLLDKGQNQLYLSHSLPGMDYLEPVYVYIWNFIHSREMWGSDEDISYVRISMIDAMYGIVTEQELQELSKTEKLWENFVKHKFVGTDGRILIRADLENYSRTGKVYGNLNAITQFGLSESDEKELLAFLKNKMRQGILLPLPQHLQDYVDLHLSTLVENAFAAKLMVQNDNYIIDSDRTEAANSTAPNIIIMDKDTGEEQYHSQWSNGLHQFLQLKHGTRLSTEGLKAVYMSNVSFFSKYGSKLFGLSGTLGSARERDLLKSIYQIGYSTIPSFRPSKFTEEMVKVCKNNDEWMNAIVKTSEHIYQEQGRPVLVICESVRDVEKLERQFKAPVQVYKHSYEPLSVGTDTVIDKACIILATNLAGRGTDIQISETISQLGGMHVCLTYLPPNLRVEEQAFGRAGRKGQKGTGQIVCLSEDGDQANDMLSVVKMKMKRNIQEEEHIAKILEQYESVVKVEEAFFEKFQSAYRAIDNGTKKFDKKVQKIVLNSCLDLWAFCLDKAAQQGEEHVKSDIIDQFVSRLQSFPYQKEESLLDAPNHLIQGPSHCTELAKILIEKKKFKKAFLLLDNLVTKDSRFSETAHYYLSHCVANELNVTGNLKDRKKFFQHLSQAETLIRKRCLALSSYASVVSHISETYTTKRESFLFADDYKKQKQDMIEVLHVFLRTIDDLKGHPISYASVQLQNVDSFKAFYVFNSLRDREILQPAEVVSNIPKDVMNEINDKYNVYYKELWSVIQKHENHSVTADTFKDILPSRQELWQLLLDRRILSNEKTFVLLDKDMLKKELEGIPPNSLIVRQVIAQMLELKGCKDLDKVLPAQPDSENKTAQSQSTSPKSSSPLSTLCLHPEQIPDVLSMKLTVIPLHEFQSIFGSLDLWEFLVNRNILSVNKSANLHYSDQVRIGKYDGLRESAFMEIEGISDTMAREIYSDLKNCHYKSILEGKFELKHHREFQAEIETVASTQIQYRQALDELAFSGKMIVDSLPHKDLYEDLLKLNVINPVRVNHGFSSSKIKSRITEMFGTRGLADKVLDDSEDVGSKTHRMKKAFKYPASVSFGQITSFCQDRDEANRVWEFLIDQKCIDEYIIESDSSYYVTCNEEKLKRLDLPVPVKLFLASVVTTREVSAALVSNMQQLQSSILNFDQAITQLSGLETIPDPHTKREEISMCKTNGFGDILSLGEKKWTWKALGKMAVIAFIGLGQIALGVLLEIYSLGVGTYFASALVSEGVGDILFAIQCLISGNCTWASYWEHKKFSVAISLATAGVGALYNRGAQFSKYGYKLGGSYKNMTSLAGSELFEKFGKQTVYLAAAKSVTKKVLQTGAVRLASGAADMVVDQLLNNFITKISQQIVGNLKEKVQKSGLKDLMTELCKRIGLKQARQVLTNTTSDDLSWKKWINDIRKKISECGGAIMSGFREAFNKSSRSGNKVQQTLSTLTNVLSHATTISKYLGHLQNIYRTVDGFTQSMRTKIKDAMAHAEGKAMESTNEESSKMSEDVIKQWQEDLTQSVSYTISEEIAKPVLRSGAQMAVYYACDQIKSYYKEYQTRQLVREVKEEREKCQDELLKISKKGNDDSTLQDIKAIHKEYTQAVTKVLERTKNPDLFAKLVKEEGLPMGIHCAQAMANICQRPIVINVKDGNSSLPMPSCFEPTCASTLSDPIHIDFTPGADGSVGHFSVPGGSEGGGKLSYDCMLDAVCCKTGEKLSREDIAHQIQTDPLIRQHIEMGIHKNYMARGVIGGIKTTDKKQAKFDQYKKDTEEKGKFKTSIKKTSLRDEPVAAPGASRRTGNDELFQISDLRKWVKRHLNEMKANGKFNEDEFGYLDLFFNIRVETQYSLFKANDGSLNGHSTVLFRDRHPLTVGQPGFHKKRNNAIKNTKTAGEALKVSLTTHLELVISPDELRNTDTNGIVTANGFDLSDKEQKDKFCDLYEMNYYKQYLIAKKVGAIVPNYTASKHIKKDPYMTKVKQEVKSAKTIKSIGDILKDRPYADLGQRSRKKYERE